MADPQIAAIQQQLRTARAGEAWQEFLSEYSPLVLQAVQYCVWDAERAADCFVFVCEKLRERNYRRLLQYRPAAPTNFVSWWPALHSRTDGARYLAGPGLVQKQAALWAVRALPPAV